MSRCLHSLRDLAAERVFQSSWTQKTLDRALKQLSNNIHLNKINLVNEAEITVYKEAVIQVDQSAALMK